MTGATTEARVRWAGSPLEVSPSQERGNYLFDKKRIGRLDALVLGGSLMEYPERGMDMDNKPRPLISVVIAVLNGVETLARCLESIRDQVFRDIEVIVMDGGSTDGTTDVLGCNQDVVSYYESSPDRGIAHAWNKAIDRARGKWIIFLGADDRFHDSNALRDIVEILASDTKHDVVYGQIVFGDGRYAGRMLGERFNWSTHKRRMCIPHTACFQRRRLFEEIGGFDEDFRIALDYEILLRKSSLEARFVPRLITVMGGGGMSTRLTVRSLKESRSAQLKNRVGSLIWINIWYWLYRIRSSLTESTQCRKPWLA